MGTFSDRRPRAPAWDEQNQAVVLGSVILEWTAIKLVERKIQCVLVLSGVPDEAGGVRCLTLEIQGTSTKYYLTLKSKHKIK